MEEVKDMSNDVCNVHSGMASDIKRLQEDTKEDRNKITTLSEAVITLTVLVKSMDTTVKQIPQMANAVDKLTMLMEDVMSNQKEAHNRDESRKDATQVGQSKADMSFFNTKMAVTLVWVGGLVIIVAIAGFVGTNLIDFITAAKEVVPK